MQMERNPESLLVMRVLMSVQPRRDGRLQSSRLHRLPEPACHRSGSIGEPRRPRKPLLKKLCRGGGKSRQLHLAWCE
jgi:hypothetical protein